MTLRVQMLLAMLAAALPAAAGDDVFSSYFAPVNQLIFKVVMPGGVVQELEYDHQRPGVLRSADGWSGQMADDGRVRISSPRNGGELCLFDRGRLTLFRGVDGCKEKSYDSERTPPDGIYPPLLVSREATEQAAREYSYGEFLHKWEGSGRLAFPYVNPNQNGTLYAELFLLFLAFAAGFRARAARVACAALSMLSVVCLVWTMSRGAWLGALAGLSCFAALGLHRFMRNRTFWIAAGVVALTFAAWVAMFGAGQITRGLDGVEMNWTNAIRLEIWSRAPRMMVDAPCGWGNYIPGAAYLDWYQPIGVFALTPTLINDHLTRLVAYSWTGRFLYVLCGFLILALSLLVMVFRRNPLPLAVWLVLAISASFNPVSHRWELWLVPALSCVTFWGGAFWRRWRVLACAFTAVVLMAAAVVAGLAALGSSRPEGYVPISFDGARVSVNGRNPKIWIVDDGTLGGGLTGKDIREYYTYVRRAPSVGYVRSVGDLPDSVDRLVLAGHAGADWLTKLSEDERARDHLPKSVLFVSPPFSPSQVPEGVRALCRPRIVVGEFAAMFDSEYAQPHDWVTIVPGMEKYILRWMEHVMEL